MYRGVEIRVRCVLHPRTQSWSATYSFFTGAISRRYSDRVSGAPDTRHSTEEAAAETGFAAAYTAVDQAIRVAEITGCRVSDPPRSAIRELAELSD
jgi:hypothetical protein